MDDGRFRKVTSKFGLNASLDYRPEGRGHGLGCVNYAEYTD
jgi:hypothetical protein